MNGKLAYFDCRWHFVPKRRRFRFRSTHRRGWLPFRVYYTRAIALLSRRLHFTRSGLKEQ